MEQATIFDVMKIPEDVKIHFRLSRDRPDMNRVDATFYGLRVEIDCFDDNHIEISIFKGDEDIEGGFTYLKEIVQAHADG